MNHTFVSRRAELLSLSWPEFFKALQGYLRWKEAVKINRVGESYLCSYYTSPTDWNVWWLDNRPAK